MTPPILDPTRRWECPSCGAQHITRDPRPVTPMHQCREHHGLDMPFAEVRAGRLELGRGTVTHRIIERGDWVGGGYGVAVNDSATLASLMIVQDDTGWATPGLPQPWRKVTDAMLVNAGAFTSTYRTNIQDLVGDVIITVVVTSQPAGVTGEIRLNFNGVGTTSVKVLPAGVTTVTDFRWLHGAALASVSAQLDVEVRRTAGASDITVYEPDPCYVRSSLLVVGESSGGVFS